MEGTLYEGEDDYREDDVSDDGESDERYGSFKPSETVTLPIGLDIDGTRYRTVHIDEMTGYDDEALSDKKHRNNGAKAITTLLRRCIQGHYIPIDLSL